jgi:hypothetical protein
MPDDPSKLMDPPRYDMLTVKFRGDQHTLLLPYCEVVNGNITQIENEDIEIATLVKNKRDMVRMSFSEFIQVVEHTFDHKEIVGLSVQLAGSYEQIKLL